jgi:hypothetical protein
MLHVPNFRLKPMFQRRSKKGGGSRTYLRCIYRPNGSFDAETSSSSSVIPAV